MLDLQLVVAIAIIGFAMGTIGGLGAELLERFIGRSLEAYCRLQGRRGRFGEVLDRQEDATRGALYLRIIGNVLFLSCGTIALIAPSLTENGVDGSRLLSWMVVASSLVMFTHLWLPAAVTRFASAPVLYRTWPFWNGLAVVMHPLSIPGVVVEWFARRLSGQQEDASEEEELLEDEIRTIITAGTRDGHFGPGVREMIQGVMDMHDDSVSHIMTPRSDVDAIEIDTPWPEILKVVVESGRTRLPVYRENLDNVVGVLYVKDLLTELSILKNPNVPLEKLLRRTWTVPASKRVDELLQEFLHSRSHMAIVLDERHQVSGVVTIEDSLEEIVGEIVDESDDEEQTDFHIVDEKTADMSGRIMVDEVNERLGWELAESDDYETIAGYVLHHVGYMPRQDEAIELGPLEIKILRATSRQLERLRLRHIGNSALEAG
ncbi:Magnesium and cobalt efflux protein CorC [Rosistilla carotiformis]|uniref:Magnesium and cobalt efflux protein CorC n=1 Tax=Rosistilla carotiformis TaxID=2528017 RepID=A0A518JUF8_9BACT|nr:hemolysin family protein [Rosistilla carotiformis]QDV69173.1 Magnesium and cobalt efflux protein CorC [Rosistilla carotiformis]